MTSRYTNRYAKKPNLKFALSKDVMFKINNFKLNRYQIFAQDFYCRNHVKSKLFNSIQSGKQSKLFILNESSYFTDIIRITRKR